MEHLNIAVAVCFGLSGYLLIFGTIRMKVSAAVAAFFLYVVTDPVLYRSLCDILSISRKQAMIGMDVALAILGVWCLMELRRTK